MDLVSFLDVDVALPFAGVVVARGLNRRRSGGGLGVVDLAPLGLVMVGRHGDWLWRNWRVESGIEKK